MTLPSKPSATVSTSVFADELKPGDHIIGLGQFTVGILVDYTLPAPGEPHLVDVYNGSGYGPALSIPRGEVVTIERPVR